ncbi:hypothetical protein M407DRAFT_28438 [Tulasnella calospora MUT 4182]|uniref:Uncharacterized protein n=2 Tax=Tulasnella calospora MUT 4182 TaxID=1051891 RepID=A0A0C3KKT0_9AGAM|nr:hypothetical protein M407DRAFT_28438 [Tulasnella calospora MUT 4182]
MDLTLDTATPRSSSPESSSTATTSSLFRASNTIDDLTRALASFSRGATPEPPLDFPLCCCERENCEATLSWLQAKEKLEKKLELSAEIGQALLERHEAYVRRHDKMVAEHDKKQTKLEEQVHALRESNSTLVARMAELIRESSQMEKRLTQADLNLQVADASNRTLLNELQDTRSAMTRVTTQNARSVGWETRLANVMQERDDIAQEIDAERQRSRTAEAKAAGAAAKYSELQAEVLRLRDELEQAHASRSDFSALLIQDARARLEGLQNSLGLQEQPDAEVTKILENLVADNEAIKRDNAELQNMLTESREELRLARDELAELQATTFLAPSPIPPTPSPRAVTPSSFKIPTHARRQSSSKGGSGWAPPATALISTKGHRSVDSWASNGPLSPYSRQVTSPMFSSTGFPWRRASENVAVHKRSRSIDSTSGQRPYTAGDRSPAPPESITSPSVEYSVLSGDAGDDTLWTANPVDESPQKPRARPRTLMLLSRSKGVQTDGTGAELPDPLPPGLSQPLLNTHRPPHLDPPGVTRPQYSPRTSSISDSFGFATPLRQSTNSETSSLDFNTATTGGFDPRVTAGATASATLPALIERVTALHTRVSQADVRTLHNRLKRQHIVGGDVGHLSKSTLKSIMLEVNNLRSHFKSALDAAGVGSPSLANGEEPTSIVNRTDLRALLKASRDLLAELIQLRSTLNTVTLDPSFAKRLKDQAFSDAPRSGTITPEGEEDRGRSTKLLRPPAAMGWIAAPIQKLFSVSNTSSSDIASSEAGPSKRSGPEHGPQTLRGPRMAPKLAPAIAATTATVNVEFGSTGTKRATVDEGTTETIDASTSTSMSRTNSDNVAGGSLGRASASRLGLGGNKSPPALADDSERSRNLLGIFAGAPTSSSSRKDAWVVVPNRGKTDRRAGSTAASLATDAPIHSYRAMRPTVLDGPGFDAQRRLGIGNIGGVGASMRATSGFNPNRLSRIVDAVIDDNASIAPSEPERTLRGRNLSDSSIHSSFVRQGPVQRLLTPAAVALSAPSVDTATPTPTSTEPSTFVDRESVLQSLSRKVQNFVQSGGASTPATSQPTLPPDSPQQQPRASKSSGSPSASSPPKPIPGTGSRNARGVARSSSRSAHRRDTSPSGRMLSFVQSVGSWVPPNAESLIGTPSASFREGSPLAAQSRLRKESRGGTDF